MLDIPPLVLIGLATSLVTAFLAWRRRKASTTLSLLSDDELYALLSRVQATPSDPEVSRRVTIVILEELERRRA